MEVKSFPVSLVNQRDEALFCLELTQGLGTELDKLVLI